MRLPSEYLARSRRIAAFGQCVSAAEGLARRDLYRSGELLSPQIRHAYPKFARKHPHLTALLEDYRFIVGCDTVKAAAGLATLFLPHTRRLTVVTSTVSAVVFGLERYRTNFGRDGSDQMQDIMATIVALSSAFRDREEAADFALRAINTQLAVSYFASGAIKLVSDDWRSGRAFVSVMRTEAYGHPRAAAVLDKIPASSLLVCWGTILGETLYPLLYLVPKSARVQRALPIAGLFHLAIGHFMGLPRFVWAFGATHPAASYVLEGGSAATASSIAARIGEVARAA